jgi:hypothetical protein
MKTFFGWMVALIIIGAIAALFFYKYYLPGLVAKALVQQEEPPYIPKFVQTRISRYKAPVNKGAEDVIREMHRRNVDIDQVLKAIDETEEEQIYLMLDELNQTRVTDTDQVFNVAKKYFRTDFDLEVLRKPFNENVDTAMIRKGLKQAAYHRNEEPIDPEMAKAILKQVLVQKEREYRRNLGGR